MSQIAKYLQLSDIADAVFQPTGLGSRMEPVTVSGLRYDILNAALKKAVEEIEVGLTTQEAIWLQFELRTAVIHPDAPPEDWYTGSSVVREVSKYIRSARGDREAVRKELHKVNNMRRERY